MEVRSIIEQEVNTDDSEEKDSDQGDEIPESSRFTTTPFQTNRTQTSEVQPPSPKAQDQDIVETIRSNVFDKCLLSDKDVTDLKVRALHMSNRAGSPKILVTFNHAKAVLLVDEGSEINCIEFPTETIDMNFMGNAYRTLKNQEIWLNVTSPRSISSKPFSA